MQGQCRSMGCDGSISSNSGKTKDACGVCGGNNSTCESVTNKFQRKLRRGNNNDSITHFFDWLSNIVRVIKFKFLLGCNV